MTTIAEASRTQRLNIIDMGLTFTAMIRVFEAGSKNIIIKELDKTFNLLQTCHTKEDFEYIHCNFCNWFIDSVKTAKKVMKNKVVKPSRAASYGHGAKVFDIVSKVYIYYSSLPSIEISVKLRPFLHGAIDTPILDSLKHRYPNTAIIANSIEAIDRITYKKLQILIEKHLTDDFEAGIFPVQYDDIQWSVLNRRDA